MKKRRLTKKDVEAITGSKVSSIVLTAFIALRACDIEEYNAVIAALSHGIDDLQTMAFCQCGKCEPFPPEVERALQSLVIVLSVAKDFVMAGVDHQRAVEDMIQNTGIRPDDLWKGR